MAVLESSFRYVALSNSRSRSHRRRIVSTRQGWQTGVAMTRQTYTFKAIGDCEIRADVYSPASGGARPGIVWIHGGALSYMRRFPRFLSRRKKGIAASLAIFSIGACFRWEVAARITGGEKEEAFDFYQEGQTGRGLRRVLILDLGDGVTMELVRIQAGKFQMGSPPGEKERRGDEDQHGVEITRDFYLGKYEGTRGQFRAFVKDT